MLLAQALVAAGRTVEEAAPHALHAHFLRPGRHGQVVEWDVERARDGWQFGTRRVVGRQAGDVIFLASVSFVRDKGLADKGLADKGLAHKGLAHEDPMPVAPAPEGLPDWEDLRVRILGDAGARRPDGPLEVRDCDPGTAVPAVGRPARRALWIRPRGTLPDDPLIHAAVLVFASDRGLLSTAARPHGLMWGEGQGASLDHAVWLHRPARFDGWVLFTTASPVAVAGRGLVLGAMHAASGARLASVAQEGLIRVAR
jgi:acyl-CoA thioesterase-2